MHANVTKNHENLLKCYLFSLELNGSLVFTTSQDYTSRSITFTLIYTVNLLKSQDKLSLYLKLIANIFIHIYIGPNTKLLPHKVSSSRNY